MKNLKFKKIKMLIVFGIVVDAISGCRSRNQTQLFDANGDETGLDVNDVSFLYPPMGGRFPHSRPTDLGRDKGTVY